MRENHGRAFYADCWVDMYASSVFPGCRQGTTPSPVKIEGGKGTDEVVECQEKLFDFSLLSGPSAEI